MQGGSPAVAQRARSDTATVSASDERRPEIFALFGPTGVGKTAVAVALAEKLRGRGEDPVAVSADALQVYAGLETLTGVASGAQRERLEHRLISFLPLDAGFSVGEYAQLAHAEIDDLLAAGRRPIVVGGTGLYLRAALAELDLRPAPSAAARARWSEQLQRRGPRALHELLAQRAPWAAETIDPCDSHRLVRALELLDAGELEPPSAPSQLWSDELRHPALLADDVDGTKRRTRNYARRQLTWMRKLAGVRVIDVTGRDPADVAAEILAGGRPPEAGAYTQAR